MASKTRKFLHLEGFIISPVQRLCKYPLLLRELKKFTPESHNDHQTVKDAMKVNTWDVLMLGVGVADRFTLTQVRSVYVVINDLKHPEENEDISVGRKFEFFNLSTPLVMKLCLYLIIDAKKYLLKRSNHSVH